MLSNAVKQYLSAIALSALTFGLAPQPVSGQSQPSLQFDPPSGTRLSSRNAAVEIVLDLGGYTWATLPWDWRSPTVILNGRDISNRARSLVAGATGVALDNSQVIASTQTLADNSMTLRLSGMRLSPGFHQLLIRLEPLGANEPLEFRATYPAIAGQEQQQL
ncbi:MAG: hypothetical protein AAFY15_03630 [Cyanobacteria bacterium J06648_11]